MKKNYAILCLAIASLTQLQAQAPEGFNYQATVRSVGGELIVNQNVYFKFNVIQGSQTAVPIFTETHYVPTDDLGQVNLVIGQGTANTGVFSELDWSLGSYYLGIELDTDTGNNYEAMGTTQLLSVPYALYAANSGNATPTTPNLEAVLAQNNSANSQQIKDLQDPTEAQDAVTKNYIYSKEEVDELISAFEDRINLLENLGRLGTVTDQDGNTYDYLTYGAQKWTVENAEMVTYRDGTPIPEVTGATEWSNLTTGAWAYYDNDSSKHRLYNWYAVMGIHDAASLSDATLRKAFAPEGWHVPSDTEWTTLEEYLIANGYNYDQTTTGNKLGKAMASTTGWTSTTQLGAPANDQSLNNSSGFNGFPEGYRGNGTGSFGGYGSITCFWSSTKSRSNLVWDRYLLSSLYRFEFAYMDDGFSVRFVKGNRPDNVDNDNDGYTENQGDCDDTNAQINPGATELEDGIDNDCDGEIDEGFESAAISGSWRLAPEAGALGVGPELDNISWWSNSSDDVTTRACVFDDTYVFNADGSFQNVLGADTWIEGWQGAASEECGAPVAPHDGSAAATYTYDEAAGTITLNGVGAFLGFAKVVNGSELQSPADAADSITYLAALSDDGNTLDLDIEVANGGFWSFRLVKDTAIDSNDTDDDNDGYSENQGDCDDTDAQINPGATELEDGIDNDCDGEIDEGFGESGQFELAPAPTTDPNDVISVFSDTYENIPVDYFNGYWEPYQTTLGGEIVINGEDVLKYSEFNFVGTKLTTPLDISEMTHLSIDILMPVVLPTDIDMLIVLKNQNDAATTLQQQRIGGQTYQWSDQTGDINDTDANATFEEGGVWKTIKIPLRPTSETGLDKTGVNLILIERIKSSNVTDLHIDNMYFFKEDPISHLDTDDDNDGYTENQGDCDDTDASINPGATELEDGIDNDCDGEIDEGFLVCAPETTESYNASNLNMTFQSDPSADFISNGAEFSWVDNPDYDNTVNTSCKVGKVVKLDIQSWDNIRYDLDAKLDFSSNSGLKIKVWSARANTEVRLKLEEIGNAGNFVEKFFTTSVTSGWEELTFPFTAANSGKFNKIIILFDLGANNTDTYYFDDLKLYGDGAVGNCPAVPAGELLANGDFEAGDIGCWQLLDGVTISTTVSNGGTHSAELQGSTGAAVGLRMERFGTGLVTPNTSYTVTFDMIASDALGEGGVVKAFTFSEGADGGTVAATQHIHMGNTHYVNTSAWESKTFTFTTPGNANKVEGGLSLLIEIVNSTARLNVDNVSVRLTP